MHTGALAAFRSGDHRVLDLGSPPVADADRGLGVQKTRAP